MTGVRVAEAPAGESSIGYEGWRIVAAASCCVFVSFASLLVYTFSVFLKPLTAEFGWSREAAGAAFGFAALSVAAVSPGLGALLDRYPARRIILPCMAVFGCTFASLSLLTDHIWHLYAVFIVLGLVGNGTAHLAYTRALTTWFHDRRGTAFALLMAGGALGAMVLPPFTDLLIRHGGWRTACLILGAIVLAVGLPLGSRVRERPGASHAETFQNAGGLSVKEALKSWPFWIIVVVLFCVSISQNGAITHLSALLTDRGVSSQGGALAASALGGAILAGRLITGWLIDRFFAPWVGVVLLLISALGAFVLASARTMIAGAAASAMIGFGMGGEGDFTPYLLTKYFGVRSFSTLYGASWTAYAIAGAIGPIIMGKAFDVTGSYEALLAQLAALTAVAAGLLLFLPRYPATDEIPTSSETIGSPLREAEPARATVPGAIADLPA